MGKHNSKGRSKGEARHVRLYHSMMRSDAWRSLDAVARCAYVEIASRYGGTGSNNGRIPYSLREMAEALGVGKATAMRAVQRLQERGFVVQTKRGAFSMKVRHATEWRLTEYACDVSGNLATKDWQAWSRKNHGCRDETVRVPRRNRTGSVVKRPPTENPSYGFTTEPVNCADGFTREPLVVYQVGSAISPASTGGNSTDRPAKPKGQGEDVRALIREASKSAQIISLPNSPQADIPGEGEARTIQALGGLCGTMNLPAGCFQSLSELAARENLSVEEIRLEAARLRVSGKVAANA